MTETATGLTYDPIPDLAHLLCAAQRQPSPLGGLAVPLARLCDALGLPELAYADEADEALRGAVRKVTKGDVVTIAPERGPLRRMLVSHVEHHIITLADLEGETP